MLPDVLPGPENTALWLAEGDDDNRVKDGKLWCERCKQLYHTVDTYWKIHGNQQNGFLTGSRIVKKGFQAAATPEGDETKSDVMFSKTQL